MPMGIGAFTDKFVKIESAEDVRDVQQLLSIKARPVR